MKILIVSDTHRRINNLELALQKAGPVDMMLHLGDLEGSEAYIETLAQCPVHMIAGNNDFYTDLPREKVIQIGKYKVFMTHGHHYYASMTTEFLKKEARARGAQVVMFGHTHLPMLDMQEEDLTVLNPGSLTYPRQDGRRPSYIVMEIDRFDEAHYTICYL